MFGESIEKVLKKLISGQSLASGAIATGLHLVLGGEGFTLNAVASSALTIGAPTVLGSDVGHYVDATLMGKYSGGGSPTSPLGDIMVAAVAGGVVVGVLGMAGVLDTGFNQESMVTFAIAGGSSLLGKTVIEWIQDIDGKKKPPTSA